MKIKNKNRPARNHIAKNNEFPLAKSDRHTVAFLSLSLPPPLLIPKGISIGH